MVRSPGLLGLQLGSSQELASQISKLCWFMVSACMLQVAPSCTRQVNNVRLFVGFEVMNEGQRIFSVFHFQARYCTRKKIL